MTLHRLLTLAAASALAAAPLSAQETPDRSQMTIGNGEHNLIQTEGMTRRDEPDVASHVRVDEDRPTIMRANSTSITVPRVVAAQSGWIVLHPFIDGRPDGDIVSGYAYLEAGENLDVVIRMPHPASAGDKYIVMLHKDADKDRVFDFVFVEDGINVEDVAVFEGNRMIAHIIALPE